MDGTEEPKVDPKVEKQKTWLTEITGKIVKSQENLAALEDRAKGKALIDGLDSEKAGIRETLLGIEVKVGGVFGKKMKLLDEKGEYQNEIDTWHHTKEMREGMTPEQLKVVTAQVDKIMKVQEQLKSNPYYYAPEPEFTQIPDYDFESMTEEEQIKAQQKLDALLAKRQEEEDEYARIKALCDKHMAEDLWEPMVREGIIPENFVPQDYSAVVKLFDNASAAYEERLQEYSANLTEKDILAEKFGVGFKIGKAVIKLGASASGLVGEIGTMKDAGELTGQAKEANDKLMADAKEAKEFFDQLETALTIGEGITKVALTDKDFTAIGESMADAMGKFLGGMPGLSKETATIVTCCVSNAVRAVSVAKKLAKGDIEGAFTDVVNAIAAELKAFDPVKGGGAMTFIGKQMAGTAGSVIKALNLPRMLAEKRSPLEIMGALMDMADGVVGPSVEGVGEDLEKSFQKSLAHNKDKKEEEDEEEDEDEDEDEDEEKDEEEDTSGDDYVKGEKVRTAKFDMEALKKRQLEADAASAEKIKQSQEEQAEAERAEFEHHLRSGFPMAMSDEEEVNQAETDRIQSIEYLIAIQKKNEATFNMAKQIADKGMGLLVKLFPPASIAQALMTLAFTIKDAVEQTQELILWCENVEDATAAGSAQVDAMLNRRGLQTKQMMRAQVQVAIDAAKVVAEVLAVTPAAPAGPVVKAAAETTEAAIELADLIYTEAQLAKAWGIYQQARAQPQDRYLAREATRENPTLSKYAMAYGSLNGDPIAIEGMRRCGLDKQTLAVPGTNVAKVVQYLEAKYPDDPVLLRAVPVPDKWYPGPIELTAASFMSFYRMATTKASPKLSGDGDSSGLAAALGRLVEAEAGFQAALDKAAEDAKLVTVEAARDAPVELDPKAKSVLVSALLRAKDQAKKFKPLAEDRSPHTEMAKYVDALAARAEQRLTAVSKITADRPWEKLYKKAA
jgi:hypothetical protein